SRDNQPQIILRQSTDAGASWDAGTQLTDLPGTHPSLAAWESRLYLVWGDLRAGHAEIYGRRSTDFGVTWEEEQRLTDLPDASWTPSIAVQGDDVYLAWVDTRDGNEEEYFKRSRDGGVTWGPDTRLTNNPANSWAPSLAVSGQTLHLVWFDQ